MLSSNNFTVDEDYSNLCSDPRVNISKHLHIMCACVFSSQGVVVGGGDKSSVVSLTVRQKTITTADHIKLFRPSCGQPKIVQPNCHIPSPCEEIITSI